MVLIMIKHQFEDNRTVNVTLKQQKASILKIANSMLNVIWGPFVGQTGAPGLFVHFLCTCFIFNGF